MASVYQIQDEIIEEFARLEADTELILCHLMEIGKQLPPMQEAEKDDKNLIKGCQSKVWLMATLKDDKVYFSADSNTGITRGLISLLIRIFDGQPPKVILYAALYFMHENRLDRFIGTQRTNGFAAMISQMKVYAQQFMTN